MFKKLNTKLMDDLDAQKNDIDAAIKDRYRDHHHDCYYHHHHYYYYSINRERVKTLEDQMILLTETLEHFNTISNDNDNSAANIDKIKCLEDQLKIAAKESGTTTTTTITTTITTITTNNNDDN